jgi:uncharacterized protein
MGSAWINGVRAIIIGRAEKASPIVIALTPMKPRVVKCPQCGSAVAWTPDSQWRPFCSERCKLIDLGAWASERYRIEAPESTDSTDIPPDSREDS